jgi:hypothetical protein
VKTLVTISLSLFAVASLATASPAANSVRISQVYGGGGTISGNTARDSDYVELFNASATPVDLTGWTIEYASPTGNYGSAANNIFTFPEGASILPCSYVLVAMDAGLSGFPLPVEADYFGTLQMSATNGKVGLFNAPNVNTSCGGILPGTLVDKVSYGTGNCPETAATGALSVSLVDVRNLGGMTDTDDNLSDFTREAFAEPRSSASERNLECLAVPAGQDATWGKIKSIYRK